MCTIILLYKMSEEYPIIFAENRDIHRDAREKPPHLAHEDPDVYSAIDINSNGTWFGLNEYNVLAGLTNLYSNNEEIKPTNSVGRLFRRALEQSSAEEVSGYLKEHFNPQKHRKANILAVDKEKAILTMCDETIDTKYLNRGIHVLTNYNLKHKPRSEQEEAVMIDSLHRWQTAHRLINEHGLDSEQDINSILSKLKIILKNHDETYDHRGSSQKEYFRICCHDAPAYDWKTMSSSIVALSINGIEGSIYLYAPGNPCETAYEDYSWLLNS